MSAPRSYFIPGCGYFNETVKNTFPVAGWCFINANTFSLVYGYVKSLIEDSFC